MNSSTISRRIRPEARPIEWSKLNLSQQEAFRRTVYTIDEALTVYHSDNEDYSVEKLIHRNRTSNAMFLSGTRGTGKTSVLLSLMGLQPGNKFAVNPIGSKRFTQAMERVSKNTVWLEPIDMDPLPEPFSLLTTILDRIWQAAQREVGKAERLHTFEQSRDQYGLSSDNLQVEEQFRHLYTMATLAWDSNIELRKPLLDPDYYALELQRTNRARQSLNQKIAYGLREYSKLAFANHNKPLFVVTIDDFDMHPSSALHVLKMLRMLSAPQLFILMLGDMTMLELMADLSTSQEVCSLIPKHVDSAALGFDQAQVGQSVGAISHTTLRKVLPTQQRAFIHSPTIIEGMNFRPTESNGNASVSEPTPTLASLAGNIPFLVYRVHRNNEIKPLCDLEQESDIPKTYVGGFPVFSLLGCLLNPGIQLAKTLIPAEGHYLASQDVTRTVEELQTQTLHLSWQPYGPQMRPYETLPDHFSRFEFYQGEERAGRNHNAEDKKLKSLFLSKRGGISVPFEISSDSTGISQRTTEATARLMDVRIKENCFWATEIFAANPRVLADLWFLLRKQADLVTRTLQKDQELVYSNTGSQSEPSSADLTLKTVANAPRRVHLDNLFESFEVNFIQELSRFCRDILLEEPAFSSKQRESINVSMSAFTYGDFNWSELPMKLISVTDSITTIPGQGWARNRVKVPLLKEFGSTVRNLYHEVRISKVRDWSIIEHDRNAEEQTKSLAMTQQINKGNPSKEISRFSTASLMILHDMMKLGTRRDHIESTLVPADDGTLNAIGDQKLDAKQDGFVRETNKEIWCRWAGIRYKGSYRNFADLHWPPPSVMSFWALDMFRRHWNNTIELSKHGRTECDKLEILAYGWISGGCAVIDGQPLDSRRVPSGSDSGLSVIPDYEDWLELCWRLNRIAKDYFEKHHLRQVEQTQRTRQWLQNVIIMMMPESGLPSQIMFQLLFGLYVKTQGNEDFPKDVALDRNFHLPSYLERNLKELDSTSKQIIQSSRLTLSSMQSGKTKQDSGQSSRFRETNLSFWRDPISVPNSDIFSGPPDRHNKEIEEEAFDNYFSDSETLSIHKPSDKRALHNWFENKYCEWLRGTYLVRFMDEYKTEIRARRGVRLSQLSQIGNGSFTERMLRYQSIHLANPSQHGEFKTAYGSYERGNKTINVGLSDVEYGADERAKQKIENAFTLGKLFKEGGGLVPHVNEVPGLVDLRERYCASIYSYFENLEKASPPDDKLESETSTSQESSSAIKPTVAKKSTKKKSTKKKATKKKATKKKSTKKKATKKKSTKKKSTKKKATKKKATKKKATKKKATKKKAAAKRKKRGSSK